MKARLKESHDYLTLSIPIMGRSNLNLTINRYGTKVTAPANGITDALFDSITDSFDAVMKLKTLGEYGQKMKRILEIAEKSVDINDFAMKLQSLSKG